MRIVIVTALWQRHDVARIFWAGLERVRTLWESYGHEVRAVAVGTDDNEHRRLALGAGAVYLDYPANHFLGGKLDAGFAVAEALHADYAVKFDSDDLLGNACARAYADAFRQELPYIGLQGCYFYNLRTGKAKWWGGYESDVPIRGNTHVRGEPIGIARALHRTVLRSLDWTPWAPSLPRNLDGFMRDRLEALNVHPTLVEHTGIAVDIKSDVNLGSYDHMPGEPVDPSGWQQELSPAEWQGLREGLDGV